MSKVIFYRFQPDAMDRKTLETTFVGEKRKHLLQKLVKEIEDAAESRTPVHYLVVGSRGIGKTHFITLLYHRLIERAGNALPVKLSEEEFSVYRVSDLLLRILRRSGDEGIDLSSFEKMPNDDTVSAVLEELRHKNKIILLFLENLNQIIDEQMDHKEVKRLRSILQKEGMFIVVATAPLVFHGIASHDEPFFNFFEIVYLDELEKDELKELISRVADLEGDKEFSNKIGELEHKIDAVATLTGGNPRVALLLYNLMSKSELLDTEKAFFKILDENTPYYQDIFKMLSGQQRKIFDTLIAAGRPSTPKAIAEKAKLGEGIVNSQLRRLEKDGYVISHKEGRIAKYEARERLFRLWRELRREPFGRQRLSILVEFLELWYSTEERKKILLECLRYPKEPMDELGLRKASYWFLSLPHEYREELQPTLVKEVYKLGKVEILPEIIPNGKSMQRAIIANLELLFQDKKYKEMLKVVDEAITKYKLPKLWGFKGLLLSILESHHKALECFDRAIEIEPKDALAWYSRGSSLYKLGRYEEAIKSYDKAIEIEPKDAPAWNNRGNALHELGRHEEAIKSYDKAIEIEPKHDAAWNNRGIVFGMLARYKEALECFDRAIEIEPKDAPAWNNRGNALHGLGRYEEAIKSYDKAIEMNPRDYNLWLNRGLTLINLQRFGDALESLSKATELSPMSDRPRTEDCFALASGMTHLHESSKEFEKKNYGNAVRHLRVAIDFLLKVKELKKEADKTLTLFLMEVINQSRSAEALNTALNAIFDRRGDLRELLKPFTVATEIVKSMDRRKYYDVQIEMREVVADIVKKLTGSTDLLPEKVE